MVVVMVGSYFYSVPLGDDALDWESKGLCGQWNLAMDIRWPSLDPGDVMHVSCRDRSNPSA